MSLPHPASCLRLLNITSQPEQSWKNGGGTTRELICHPPEASYENFDWRISLAHVHQAGDFSRFPGVDRHIMLIEGGSMELRQGEQNHILRPFQPYCFAGEDAVACALPQGPTKDLNLMLRRGRAHGSLHAWQGRTDSDTLAAGTHLLYVPQGSYRIQADTQSWMLIAGLALIGTATHPLPLHVQAQTPDAVLVHAYIAPEGDEHL